MWFIGTFDLEAGPSLADCNKVKHSFFDFKFYVVFFIIVNYYLNLFC